MADKQTGGKPVRVGDGTPGPGRKKGVPNKQTTLLKDMILTALDGAGGAVYLQQQAIENPTAFMTLVGKVLPLQLTGQDGGAIQIATVEWRVKNTGD